MANSGAGADGLAGQVQEAVNQIETQRAALEHSVPALDSLFDGSAAQAAQSADHSATTSGEAGAAVQILTDSASQITDELGRQIGTALESFHTQVAGDLAHVQSDATAWEQGFSELRQTVDAFEHGGEQAAANVTSAVHDLGTKVQNVRQATLELLQQFSGAAEDFHQELTTGFEASASKAAEAFAQEMKGSQVQRVSAHLTSTFHSVEAALDGVTQTADRSGQDYRAAAEAAFHSLAQDVVGGVQKQLDDAAHKLIGDTLEHMAQVFAASVAESEVGLEITAAMSPYLPEILEIKQATSEIKELIEVYKNVRSIGLGGLG